MPNMPGLVFRLFQLTVSLLVLLMVLSLAIPRDAATSGLAWLGALLSGVVLGALGAKVDETRLMWVLLAGIPFVVLFGVTLSGSGMTRDIAGSALLGAGLALFVDPFLKPNPVDSWRSLGDRFRQAPEPQATERIEQRWLRRADLVARAFAGSLCIGGGVILTWLESADHASEFYFPLFALSQVSIAGLWAVIRLPRQWQVPPGSRPTAFAILALVGVLIVGRYAGAADRDFGLLLLTSILLILGIELMARVIRDADDWR